MKLKNLTYKNWEEYYSFLYDKLDKELWFQINTTTATVIIHSVLGLPRNQIHEILVEKFPNKSFNPQYVKSISNKYRDIITELKESIS